MDPVLIDDLIPARVRWSLHGLCDKFDQSNLPLSAKRSHELFTKVIKKSVPSDIQKRFDDLVTAFGSQYYFGKLNRYHCIVVEENTNGTFTIFNGGEGGTVYGDPSPPVVILDQQGFEPPRKLIHEHPIRALRELNGRLTSSVDAYMIAGLYPRYVYDSEQHTLHMSMLKRKISLQNVNARLFVSGVTGGDVTDPHVFDVENFSDDKDIQLLFEQRFMKTPVAFLEINPIPAGPPEVHEWIEYAHSPDTAVQLFRNDMVQDIFTHVVQKIIQGKSNDPDELLSTYLKQNRWIESTPNTDYPHFRRVIKFPPQLNEDVKEALEQYYNLYVIANDSFLDECWKLAQDEESDFFGNQGRPGVRYLAFAGFILRTRSPTFVATNPFYEIPDVARPQMTSVSAYHPLHHWLTWHLRNTPEQQAQLQARLNKVQYDMIAKYFGELRSGERPFFLGGQVQVDDVTGFSARQYFAGHTSMFAFAKYLQLDYPMEEWYEQMRVAGQQANERVFTTPYDDREGHYDMSVLNVGGHDYEESFHRVAVRHQQEQLEDLQFITLNILGSQDAQSVQELKDLKDIIQRIYTMQFGTRGMDMKHPLVNHVLAQTLIHRQEIFTRAEPSEIMSLLWHISLMQSRAHNPKLALLNSQILDISNIEPILLLAILHAALRDMQEVPIVASSSQTPALPYICYHLHPNEREEFRQIRDMYIRPDLCHVTRFSVNSFGIYTIAFPPAYNASMGEAIMTMDEDRGLFLDLYEWFACIYAFALFCRGNIEFSTHFGDMLHDVLHLPVHSKDGDFYDHDDPPTFTAQRPRGSKDPNVFELMHITLPLSKRLSVETREYSFKSNLFIERYLNFYQTGSTMRSIEDIDIAVSQAKEYDIENDICLDEVAMWEPPAIIDMDGLFYPDIANVGHDTLLQNVHDTYYNHVYLRMLTEDNANQMIQPTELIYHWWAGTLRYDREVAEAEKEMLYGYYCDLGDDRRRCYYRGDVSVIYNNTFLNIIFVRRNVAVADILHLFIEQMKAAPSSPDDPLPNLYTKKMLAYYREPVPPLRFAYTFQWVVHEQKYNMQLTHAIGASSLMFHIVNAFSLANQLTSRALSFYSGFDSSRNAFVPHANSNLPEIIIDHGDDNTELPKLRSLKTDALYFANDSRGDIKQYVFALDPLKFGRDDVMTEFLPRDPAHINVRRVGAYMLNVRCLDNPQHVLRLELKMEVKLKAEHEHDDPHAQLFRELVQDGTDANVFDRDFGTDLIHDKTWTDFSFHVGPYQIFSAPPPHLKMFSGIPNLFVLSSSGSIDHIDAILIILPAQFANQHHAHRLIFTPTCKKKYGIVRSEEDEDEDGPMFSQISKYIIIPLRHAHPDSMILFETFNEAYAFMMAITIAGRFDLLPRIWPQWMFFQKQREQGQHMYIPFNTFHHLLYHAANDELLASLEVEGGPPEAWQGYRDWSTFPLHSIPMQIIGQPQFATHQPYTFISNHPVPADVIEDVFEMFEQYFFAGKHLRPDQKEILRNMFTNNLQPRYAFQQMLMGRGKTSVVLPFIVLFHLLTRKWKKRHVMFVTYSDGLVEQSLRAMLQVLGWTGLIRVNTIANVTTIRPSPGQLGIVSVVSDTQMKGLYLTHPGFDLKSRVSLLLVDEYDSCIDPFKSSYIMKPMDEPSASASASSASSHKRPLDPTQENAKKRQRMELMKELLSIGREASEESEQSEESEEGDLEQERPLSPKQLNIQRMMEAIQMSRPELVNAIKANMNDRIRLKWYIAALQAQSLTNRVNYGVNPEKLTASPYIAFDQIAKDASFRDETLQFMTTILSIHHNGSTTKQNKALLSTYTDLVDQRNFLPEEWQGYVTPSRMLNEPFTSFASIQIYIDRVLFDFIHVPDEIYQCSFLELMGDRRLQDSYNMGMEFGFYEPSKAKYDFEHALLQPSSIIGMTGTLSNHPGIIPPIIAGGRPSVFEDASANQDIDSVLEQQDAYVAVPNVDELQDRTIALLLQQPEQQRHGALIDVGAQFINHGTVEEIVEWLWNQLHSKYGVIFYINGQGEKYEYSEETKHVKFTNNLNREKPILYFYDQAHCVGFDILQIDPTSGQPLRIFGVVTLKMHLRRSTVGQAAFRLRHLVDKDEHGENMQKVQFIYVQKDGQQQMNMSLTQLNRNEHAFLEECAPLLAEQSVQAQQRRAAQQIYSVQPWYHPAKSDHEVLSYVHKFLETYENPDSSLEPRTHTELEHEQTTEQEREREQRREQILQIQPVSNMYPPFQHEYKIQVLPNVLFYMSAKNFELFLKYPHKHFELVQYVDETNTVIECRVFQNDTTSAIHIPLCFRSELAAQHTFTEPIYLVLLMMAVTMRVRTIDNQSLPLYPRDAILLCAITLKYKDIYRAFVTALAEPFKGQGQADRRALIPDYLKRLPRVRNVDEVIREIVHSVATEVHDLQALLRAVQHKYDQLPNLT